MDEEYESGEPVVRRVDEVTSEEAAARSVPTLPPRHLGPTLDPAAGCGYLLHFLPARPGRVTDHCGSALQDRTGPCAAPQPPRRHATTVLFVVVLLLIALPGFGIGHVVWQSNSASGSLPSANSPSSGSPNFPFGSGTLPYGSGTLPFDREASRSDRLVGIQSVGIWSPADSAAIALRVDPGLVDVDTSLGYANEEAAGTGIVLTSTGEVLTNNHVVDGATSIRVTDVGNGRVYTATVVGYDRSSDVAVLKLKDAAGLKVASLGDSSMVRRGEAVVGIGNAAVSAEPPAPRRFGYSSRPVDHRYGTRWRQPREVDWPYRGQRLYPGR